MDKEQTRFLGTCAYLTYYTGTSVSIQGGTYLIDRGVVVHGIVVEGVVLQGVVVVVELRLGKAWVHRGAGARQQPMDGEGVGGGVLHILGFSSQMFLIISTGIHRMKWIGNIAFKLTNLRVWGRSEG